MSASGPGAVVERNHGGLVVVLDRQGLSVSGVGRDQGFAVVLDRQGLSVAGAQWPVGRGHGRHAVVPEGLSVREYGVEWSVGCDDGGFVVVPTGKGLSVSGVGRDQGAGVVLDRQGLSVAGAQWPVGRGHGRHAIVRDRHGLSESGAQAVAGVTTKGAH